MAPHLVDALGLLLFAGVDVVQDATLLARHNHVLVAVLALFGRDVRVTRGVDHLGHQVPVGDVGGGTRRQVEGQAQQRLHHLDTVNKLGVISKHAEKPQTFTGDLKTQKNHKPLGVISKHRKNTNF